MNNHERTISPSPRQMYDWNVLECHLGRVSEMSHGFLSAIAERTVAHAPSSFSLEPSLLNEEGDGLAETLENFGRDILPMMSASPGPRYLGFVTGGTNPAALAGDWLVSALDQNVASHGEGGIAPYVSEDALGMLLDLFELDRGVFGGTFTTGATASNLLSIAAAREFFAEKAGVIGAKEGHSALPPIRVFSACPHASFMKVMGISGVGRDALVPVVRLPGTEAMDPDDLDRLMTEAGEGVAKMVVASAATVTGNDFDDFSAIAGIARKHGAWLHVDAAFGLFARLSDRFRHLCEGIELADSITCDGHKWLNVPYDCAFFFTRRMDLLEKAFGVTAVYLSNNSGRPGAMSLGVENSQRFRALPVWFTLKAYGRAGVRAVVENNCSAASFLGRWLDEDDGYELLYPVKLNVVVFRGAFKVDADQENIELLERLNASGKVFFTPGEWEGKRGIRAAFSNWMTGPDDLKIICDTLKSVRADMRT